MASKFASFECAGGTERDCSAGDESAEPKAVECSSSENGSAEDRSSEDRSSEDRSPEDRSAEDRSPENKVCPSDRRPGFETVFSARSTEAIRSPNKLPAFKPTLPEH
jgi:hypothetical protein